MRNHPLERGYYAVNNCYADGGRTRVPKTLLNREEQELQARQILEGLRGFAGSPYSESVMVPGAVEAREAGELGGLLSEIPFSPAGAAKGLGGLALAGAIRRGGDPGLLAVHNMTGTPESLIDLIRNRRSISSPSVAISREAFPFATSPTLLFSPESPLLDPTMSRSNQLIARDPYTFRERLAPKDVRLEGANVRFTEGSMPGAGQRFAIEASPDFRSFAEYERSPYGRAILGRFGEAEKIRSAELAQQRRDWLANNVDKIQAGEFGSLTHPTSILKAAARRGDPEARDIIEGVRTLPSKYAELKVSGEVPIGPRDVRAVMLPEDFGELYGTGTEEFIKDIGDIGVPVGKPSMLMSGPQRRKYEEAISSIAGGFPDIVRRSDAGEFPTELLSPHSDVLTPNMMESALDNIFMIRNLQGERLKGRLANRIYNTPEFASDVARELTGYAEGGRVQYAPSLDEYYAAIKQFEKEAEEGVLPREATLISGAFDAPLEAVKHLSAMGGIRRALAPKLGERRADRSAMDRAVNYAGGYDWGIREGVDPLEAIPTGRAYQLRQYMSEPERREDAIWDYLENTAGLRAAARDKALGLDRRGRQIIKEAADFSHYAAGGLVRHLYQTLD